MEWLALHVKLVIGKWLRPKFTPRTGGGWRGAGYGPDGVHAKVECDWKTILVVDDLIIRYLATSQ